MNETHLVETITTSQRLRSSLNLPNGARFYRCALQINPFAYLQRNSKTTKFKSESEYNKAIINACLKEGIEVIGVTDHYRVTDSSSLIEAARKAGIFAFGGFEAVAKDGVHFLCLFDPDKDDRTLERFIGECGIHDLKSSSPTGTLDSLELLGCAKRWGAVCIAAHVAADGGGLLKKLSGQTRANVWRSPDLLACALPCTIDEAPQPLQAILKNVDTAHRRERPIAIINAQDVNGPDDLKAPGSSCYIKMSEVSVEGLRQAFLDPESRIQLNSDEPPEPHTEFLAIAWEGGFLSESAIHFNGNLNVLVGGRGTGKSTLIESLRYVLALEPLGDDARKAHEGVIRYVLRSGTKISLLVRSHRPSQRTYTIERTIPNPPIVKDEAGEVLSLAPKDILPGVEVFGQHEISELTKSPEKLTLLLNRFVERDPTMATRKKTLRLELERSRSRILNTQREIQTIDERLAALPGLEETLKRFQEAGLENRLKEKSLLVREERIISTIGERLDPIKELRENLTALLPIDTAIVSSKALDGLPDADVLGRAKGALDRLSAKLQAIAKQIEGAIKEAEAELATMKTAWGERRKIVEDKYEKLLRELQKSKIDGEEFIRLRRQIEELRPLRDRREALVRDLATHEAHRRKLLSEWEDAIAADYRAIEKAAKKVSRALRDRVRVEVTMGGNRAPLEELLREEVAGNLNAAIEKLNHRPQLSLFDLATRAREGRDSLVQHFGLPQGSAERIASASPEIFMRIEELELTPTTQIELNTAPDGEPPVWQALQELSTGQKATAVLLLLLLESEAPLIVDQPEDDLDNRFITDGVVPIMRQEKRRRQFVFSTHNANIPVLGDAELIVGLSASGEAKDGSARIAKEHMASIDAKPVRELVEEILEGGKTAFEMRRLKYGF
jgi:energy-coupling factor transporter ATP-binding protein EcfA2